MLDYLLDGEPRPIDVSLDSWGKLLDTVDSDLHRRGRAVSVVRLGGVDQPSFRAPTLADRHPATLGKIEILTTDAAALLAETIDTARQSLPVLAWSASQLAVEFRGPHPERAGRRLPELIDALRTLTVLTAAIAEVVDLEWGRRPPLMAGDVTEALGDAVQSLLSSQAAGDWPRAADCLATALVPAIGGWRALFDRLEDRRAAA